MTSIAAAARRSPSETRDKISMLVATAARMAVGLGTFVVLARYLGPVQFGLIATAIAYAGFIGIATDFGLATFTLRTAGAATSDRVGPIVGEALAVKALLTVCAAVLGAVVLLVTLSAREATIYALAFIGISAASFADLAMIAVRANRRFDVEAKLVVAASIVWLVIVGGAAFATRAALPSAIAFAISRAVYLAVVLVSMKPWMAVADLLGVRLDTIIQTAHKASSYAADTVLTTFSGQMDVLIFGAVLTHLEMGIYQAGARLVQAIVPFVMVLSTVYLPTMASAVARNDEAEWRRVSDRMNLEFGGLALFAAIGFAVIGPLVTRRVYGPDYAPLISMWPAFATFVLLRFTASGFGIQLVALGRIRLRIASQLVSIAVFSTMCWLLLSHSRLWMAPWLLAIGSLPPLLILGFGLISTSRMGRGVLSNILVALAVSAGFVAYGYGYAR